MLRAAGLAVARPFDGLGLRGNDSAPVNARGVEIPAEASAIHHITTAALRGASDLLETPGGWVSVREEQGYDVTVATEADWDFAFDLNAKAQFRMIRAVLPGMIERGGGSIINIASQLGQIGVPKRSTRRWVRVRAARTVSETETGANLVKQVIASGTPEGVVDDVQLIDVAAHHDVIGRITGLQRGIDLGLQQRPGHQRRRDGPCVRPALPAGRFTAQA